MKIAALTDPLLSRMVPQLSAGAARATYTRLCDCKAGSATQEVCSHDTIVRDGTGIPPMGDTVDRYTSARARAMMGAVVVALIADPGWRGATLGSSSGSWQ